MFTLPRQRTIVAIVGVVAFLLGAALAPLHRSGPAPTPAAVAVPPAPSPLDVSSACADEKSHNIPNDAVGSIDGIVGTVSRAPLQSGAALRPNEAITLRGWAMDRDRKAIAKAVCLEVDGNIAGRAHVLYGFPRPDVATAFQSSAVALSGYDIAVPQELLSAGTHTIRLVVIDNDGSPSTLSPQRRLFVR
ncbi:MAG: hypothetical protein IAI50_08230 [Candidatus Eremiobacteraeota bacterium]|nr:hypothetical protein [Candidatus Eremiobacteraeota bacterium]